MGYSKAGSVATQTIGSSATTAAPALPTGTVYAEGYVRTASIVEVRSGDAPTATQGMQWDPTDLILLRSLEEIDNFRAIRQGRAGGAAGANAGTAGSAGSNDYGGTGGGADGATGGAGGAGGGGGGGDATAGGGGAGGAGEIRVFSF